MRTLIWTAVGLSLVYVALAHSASDAIAWSALGFWSIPLLAAVGAGLALLTRYIKQLGGNRDVFLALGTAAGVAFFLTYGAWLSYDHGRELVGDYCSYGSVSEAQLGGCKDHVGPRYVLNVKTPAGEFARGWLDNDCGPESGPFCVDVLERRQDQSP